MAAIGGGGEKVNLTAPDIAAALAPQKGRAPVMNKELADVKERMIKMGGKSVFEADVAQNPEDLMVNFDEMKRVLDGENKKVAAETNPAKKADMQKRYDRLARRYSVYDKLLNNEGLGTMNVEEQREMMAVMADLPGFCESIAIATNNTMTIEQARRVMTGKGGSLTPDQRKVIGEMVTQFANDDKLHLRLSKNLSALKIDDGDATKATDIDDLRQKVKDKADIEKKRIPFKQIMSDMGGIYTEEELGTIIPGIAERAKNLQDSLQGGAKPITLSLAEVDNSLRVANIEVARLAGIPNIRARVAAGAVDPLDADRTLLRQNEAYQRSLDELRRLLASDSNETRIADYTRYKNAKAKVTSYDTDLTTIAENERKLAKAESEQNKYADKYKRKMEVALSEEMKRYWNEVKLTQADQAAQAEAAKKGEEEAAIKEGKTKRETLAKNILDKYIHLSFLKYKDGKAVGWCDDALKKFVKTDMLSRSPARLTRDLLERINTMRYSMPPAYAKEMKAMWDEAGVGKGNPPLTIRAALDEIGKDKWEEWAADKIPDVLGYAYGRGYFFDRLRIKPAQAEFMREAYSPEFFTKALEAKEKYATSADEMVKSGLLVDGAINQAKIKEMLGGDWVKGSKMLMKTLAVAGAVGAGGFVLTGGLGSKLAFDLMNPASVGNFLKDGAMISGGHIKDTVNAGIATARAVSRVGGAVAGVVTGHLDPVTGKAAGGIQEIANNIVT